MRFLTSSRKSSSSKKRFVFFDQSIYISLALLFVGFSFYIITQYWFKINKQKKRCQSRLMEENQMIQLDLIGEDLPLFNLTDFNGNLFKFTNNQDKLYLFFFFSNIRCSPCIEKAQYMQSIFDKYKRDGLMVVGITPEPHASAIRRFTKRFSINYPILMDSDSILNQKLGLFYLTCVILANANGTILSIWPELELNSVEADSFIQKIENSIR